MEAYRLEQLSFTYPGQEAPALREISLTVERGEFIVLCGPSGCGKTTLLRQLKPALAPHGIREGTVLFCGAPLEELDPRGQAARIGFVLQAPEEQIVTDKVWHELAFGLESLGADRDMIRLRTAEMAAFFGIEDWYHRDTAGLSGGQKQLLNLASVMAMQPEVLLLDEPTSQLDPVAARTFLDCLARLNRELGVTILLSEHRLEDALPLAHRCVVLEAGKILAQGPPAQVGEKLKALAHPMFLAMPTPMRVWAAVDSPAPCPVTVGEGRRWLEGYAAGHPLATLPEPEASAPAEPALTLREVWFRYGREGADVLKGLSLTVPAGELYAVLGGNGAGKSTLLSLLTGANRPLRGEITLWGESLERWGDERLFHGNLALLPQDPKALFVGRTVEEDLEEMAPPPERLAEVITLCRLEGLLERHPYDLSGGEQQRAALAKVLLTGPRVLLLDEPTKGMDAPFRAEFAATLGRLRQRGVTVVMATHDVEFCARYATRCVLLFDGGAAAEGTPQTLFARNRFYTTAASRMAGDRIPGAVTPEEVIAACGGREIALRTKTGERPAPGRAPAADPAPERRGRPARVMGGCLLALCLLAGLLAWRGVPCLAGLAAGEWLPSLLYLAAAAAGLALLGTGRRPRPRTLAQPRATTGRPWMAAFFLLIPLTVLAGTYLLQDRKYYFISLLILLETLLPTLLSLEGRRTDGRRLTVLAVLCALAVAGRAAFFMLPQFKPVAAVAIIAGVALGGRAGFLVGAVSMLVSNFLYVQGAWTPWQMAAMGAVGLGAGLLARLGVLDRGRLGLCLYGGLSVVALYGGIMNPASVLMYQPYPTWQMIAASWALGFPMDLVHGAATAFFLWAAGPALLDKLERMDRKYGLNGG